MLMGQSPIRFRSVVEFSHNHEYRFSLAQKYRFPQEKPRKIAVTTNSS